MSVSLNTKINALGYHTRYKASGDANVSESSAACFTTILNHKGCINNETYDIVLFKGMELATRSGKSNACFLTKEELEDHVAATKRFMEVDFTIEEGEDEYSCKKYPVFHVKAKVHGNHIHHRYFLTWVRYAYEMPYNLILQDARRLKQDDLPEESIDNLFIAVANCYVSGFPNCFGEGHSIAWKKSNYLTDEELNAGMKGKISTSAYLNHLYTSNKIPAATYSKLRIDNGEDAQGNYLEYWQDEECFQRRKEKYLEMHRLLKQALENKPKQDEK